MSRRPLRSLLAAVVCAAACSDSSGPVGPATDIRANAVIAPTGPVASTVTVPMKVTDAKGHPVANSRVRFSLTTGDGTLSQQVVITDAAGVASTQVTLGQTAGANTLVAKVELMTDSEVVVVTGLAGSATAMRVTPHLLRFLPGTTAGTVSMSLVDQYGNGANGAAAGPRTISSRNPAIAQMSGTGAVTAGGTSGSTYIVVADNGTGLKDSTLVTVLAAGDPPCAGLATKATLAVGDVMTTGFVDNTVCVAATASSAEYAIVPFFDSGVQSDAVDFVLGAYGIKSPGALGDVRPLNRPLMAAEPATAHSGQMDLENRVLGLDARELPMRAELARAWYDQQVAPRRAHRATVAPAIGDKMKLNVNSIDYCQNEDYRTGRVVGVSAHSIVVVDSANPAGGFTDAEYAAYGAQFDTVSYPLDVTNFGEPTDIDNNGRIIIFFTHGVNEAGPDGQVLGFFFGRDLLPKVGEFGSCPGSNVGEVINLLVPDNTFVSKVYADLKIVETMSHEFQHLINGSRRLYINKSAAINEERWLNEGLSHIAEELTFYKVSGISARQNIGATALQTTAVNQAFNRYASDNFNRLRGYYINEPDLTSPIGKNDDDDSFEIRGAIWSYLRYVADQRFSQNEPAFWTRLVNSNTTGLQNLYDVVGTDARLVMRDWTLAIYLDDLNTAFNAKYQMPSWNYRQIMSPYLPKTINLVDKTTSGITLSTAGTIFARFATNAGSDAFISAQGTGSAPLPPHVLLALVRTK